MIVVFANEHNDYPTTLVRRWEDRGAVLMVPSDLSNAGWSCISSRPLKSKFVIRGTSHSASEIDGVLVCWPAIIPADIPYISASDRNYVSAEMNAFLVYWLTALGRPVLNRPTPRSLCGPGWFPEHWMYHAAKAGMRTQAFERSVKWSGVTEAAWTKQGQHENGPSSELTIVNGVCFGAGSPGLTEKSRALAAAAGVDLVKFRFHGSDDDACFLDADVCPRLDDPVVEEAVLAYLQRPGTDGA